MKHKLPQRCTLLAYMSFVAGLMPLQGIAQEQPQTLPEVVVRPASGTASSTEKYQAG